MKKGNRKMEKVIILKENETLKIVAENNPEAQIIITCNNGILLVNLTD